METKITNQLEGTGNKEQGTRKSILSLSKLYSLFLISCSLFLVPCIVFAQTDKVTEAFTNSYTLEYKADYTKAIAALKAVYEEDSYEMNLRLGWLHYSAGLFSEAMTYYQKAIQLKPYSVECRMGFVLPASALNDWSKVTEQYKKILEIDPQNITVNYRLGMIYYGKKEYQAAYKCFEKYVNLYPFGYDGLLMFGWTNLQLAKYREAKVLFQKTLLASPGDKSALEGLSLIK